MNENQICVVCTLSKLPLNFVIFSVGSTHSKRNFAHCVMHWSRSTACHVSRAQTTLAAVEQSNQQVFEKKRAGLVIRSRLLRAVVTTLKSRMWSMTNDPVSCKKIIFGVLPCLSHTVGKHPPGCSMISLKFFETSKWLFSALKSS